MEPLADCKGRFGVEKVVDVCAGRFLDPTRGTFLEIMARARRGLQDPAPEDSAGEQHAKNKWNITSKYQIPDAVMGPGIPMNKLKFVQEPLKNPSFVTHATNGPYLFLHEAYASVPFPKFSGRCTDKRLTVSPGAMMSSSLEQIDSLSECKCSLHFETNKAFHD